MFVKFSAFVVIKVAWIASGWLRPCVLRIKTVLYFVTLKDNTDILDFLFRLERPRIYFFDFGKSFPSTWRSILQNLGDGFEEQRPWDGSHFVVRGVCVEVGVG